MKMENPSGHLDLQSTLLLTPTIRISGKDVSKIFRERGIQDNVANRRKFKRMARKLVLNAGADVIAPLLSDRMTLLMHGFTFERKEADPVGEDHRVY